MIQENPVVTHYLWNLDAGLGNLNDSGRAEVVRDIRSHISEAVAAGEPLDRVLGSLGAAEALARAYSVELLLNKPGSFRLPGNRMLRIAGLIIVGSIPTLVVVVVLGAVGVAFSLTGVALTFAGQAALAGNLPWWVSMDADPRLAIALGPVMSVLGLACLGGLWLYVRFATAVVTKVLPPRKGQAA